MIDTLVFLATYGLFFLGLAVLYDGLRGFIPSDREQMIGLALICSSVPVAIVGQLMGGL